MSWIVRTVRRLWRELLGFGVVGLISVSCDIATFNVIIGVFHGPKVWGSLSGTAVGTVISYLGNRFWVFRNRDLRRSSTEIALYLLVSAAASGIIAACVAFNEYVLGFKSLLAANLAQFIFGQVLGSAFRFLAMHKWVFPEARKAQERAAVDMEGADGALAASAPQVPGAVAVAEDGASAELEVDAAKLPIS